MKLNNGYLYGLGAYLLWGFFPLYWKYLLPATPTEVLAHRILWSLLFLALLITAMKRWATVRQLITEPRTRFFLVLAGVTISINWGIYIYAVNINKVLETSLGYFINPLVTVLLGVIVLGEKLRTAQIFAIVVAAIAVLGLTIDYGHLPWIALSLAASFATYSLAKKKTNAGALETLTVETLVVAPIALSYLTWLTLTGHGHFTGNGLGHVLLIMGTGVITIIPLLLFGASATRMSMVSIGLLQYLAPIIQFIIGVTVLHEPMTQMRWFGFLLVWVALIIFTVDSIRNYRKQLRNVVPIPTA